MPQVELIRPIEVGPTGGSELTITNEGSQNAFYGASATVSAANRIGILAAGESLTLTKGAVWLVAEQTPVILNLRESTSTAIAFGGAILGSDGTVGGPGGSPLSSSVETGSFTGDATGATDVGPVLMKALEESPLVRLKRGGKYLINSAVFLDATIRAYQYVIDATGAEIIYGNKLPAASTLSGLTGTKWAFFNNTLRSALSGSVVTSTEANRATGVGILPPEPRLIIIGGNHNANGNIIGVVYGNGAATHIYNAIFMNIQAGVSWSGYVDENKTTNCQTSGSSPVGGSPTRFIYQRESGDGTTVENCKGFGGVLMDLAGCYGFIAKACVSGQFLLNGCLGLIEAAHQETDEIANTPYSVFLNRTQLTFVASRTNATKKPERATILIEDSADTTATTLDLIDHNEVYYFRPSPEDNVDPSRGPTINIAALNNNGRIRSWGVRSGIVNGWSGSGTQYSEGLLIASSVSAITAAIGAASDVIATGNFELSYNGTWGISPVAGAPLGAKNFVAPSFTAAEDASGIKGTLVNAQTYEYIAAVKSADGRYTPLTVGATATAGATGVNKLLMTNSAAPARIAIWRYKGTGNVTTAPDHYVEIPMKDYNGTWYDTGANINGREWSTTNIPEPATVKGTGSGFSNVTDPAGALFATFDRMALTDEALTFEAGKAQMTLVRHKGGKLTKLNFRASGTAAKGTGRAWLALVNLRSEVVAVTAERTSLAANTTAEWEVTEPLNLAPGLYYVAILQNFTEAQATVIGSSGKGSTLALLPPISTGLCPTTGLTTPPEVGKTLAVPTAGNGAVPYIWGT